MNHMDRRLYLALQYDDISVLNGNNWHEVRDQLTPSNNTLLHLACQYGSTRCLEVILQCADGSSLLQINSRGETALHLAARQGHYIAVKALINKAKSPDLQPNDLENTSTVVQNLIRASNVESETALHAAVRHNREDVVELLVEEDPSYSYPQNKYEETPLFLAAVRCYAGVTRVILDRCKSPTFGGPLGRTALHAAVMSFNFKGAGCMRLLLAKNKDLIKVADNNGWTAFHLAAHNNNGDLLKALLDANKSVAYLADKRYKRTPLHVAAYKGHDEVVKILLETLPDAWESVDGNGQNILHIALKQERKPVIEFILSEDRRFDELNTLFIQRDEDGSTPLHLIAKFGYYFPGLHPCIQNADRYVVDNTNLTPAEMLYQKHNGTLIHEVGVTPDTNDINSYWDSWTRNETPEKDEDPETTTKEKIIQTRQMANSHMIVTALVTTVALTAGFAMPGGFDGNQGPDQGSPLLLRKTAFKTFVVADTVALLFSISSLFLYFLTSLNLKYEVILKSVIGAVYLNVVSIAAMMVAFIAGTYAVLSNSTVLAISVCTISSFFLLLVFFLCYTSMMLLLRYVISRLVRYLHHKYDDFTYRIRKHFRDRKKRDMMKSYMDDGPITTPPYNIATYNNMY